MTKQDREHELVPEPTLLDVVVDTRRDVAELQFPLDILGAPDARDSAERLLRQVDDHLIPRLRELSTPAIVVVAGSTGAGKSTLVNSLLGAEISPASVIRPTTREPVLAFHPDDGALMASSSLIGSVRTVEHERVPRGLAILDAPDLDSLLTANRETAQRLLDAADLWLFVTTAARYGDALPWHALERAQERGASIALVLNRVATATLGPIRVDLLNRLKEHGLAHAPLFIVPDAGPHEGLLDRSAVAPINRWLHTLAGADHARTVILRTLRGSIAALRPWLDGLAAAVDQQVSAAQDLRARVKDAIPTGVEAFADALAADSLAAGGLEARWSQILVADPGIAKLSASRWPRPAKRAGIRRDGQLGSIVDDVRQAAIRQLDTAAEVSATAIVAALTGSAAGDGTTSGGGLAAGSETTADAGLTAKAVSTAPAGSTAPDGGPDLVTQVALAAPSLAARRSAAVTEAVGRWLAYAKARLDEITHGPGAGARDAPSDATPCVLPGAATAARGLGGNGFLAVTLLATTGIVAAHRVLDALLGSAAGELVTDLRTELATLAKDAIEAEADPYSEHLTASALHDDAVTAVRVRLAELKNVIE